MAAIKDYYTIKLHDTDAAGILFFANQFRIIHDVYELLLAKIGYRFKERLADNDFLIPIVHAESDFLAPLSVSDTIEVSLTVHALGNSSFTLAYELIDLDGRMVGRARTVHVTMDAASKSKIPLPQSFREKLEAFRNSD